MTDELVPIVDENNNRIGSATKPEAHAHGFLHPTVISEVHNSKREWLLIRQAGHKQDFGQWVSPCGGHIQNGESDEDALKREVMEELGYRDFEFKFKGKFVFNRPVKDHIENHLFLVYETYVDDEPVLNEESVESKWFNVEELKSELRNDPDKFGEAFKIVLRELYPELLD